MKVAQKAHGKRPQRLAIMFVFGLTLLLIGFVSFRSKLRRLWESLTQPVIVSQLPSQPQFDPSPVLSQIQGAVEPLLGTYGVYVVNLTTGHQYGLNEQAVFPMASLVKLPVILTLYQQGEAGELNLGSQYVLKEADKLGGAGILQSKPVGTTYTYRELAQLMGHYSDNTAYNVVLKTVGQDKVQQVALQLGMAKTSIKDFSTTPRDMARFFQRLYEGSAVNDVYQQEIFAFLTDTVFEDRIPAGLPEGTRVAHKVGTEISNFADAGIVFATDPYILVIISKDARESEAKEALPQISRLVWEFETTAAP